MIIYSMTFIYFRLMCNSVHLIIFSKIWLFSCVFQLWDTKWASRTRLYKRRRYNMEVNQPKLSKNQYDSLSYTEKHKTRSQAKAKERKQATNSPIKVIKIIFFESCKIIEWTFKLLTQISNPKAFNITDLQHYLPDYIFKIDKTLGLILTKSRENFCLTKRKYFFLIIRLRERLEKCLWGKIWSAKCKITNKTNRDKPTKNICAV